MATRAFIGHQGTGGGAFFTENAEPVMAIVETDGLFRIYGEPGTDWEDWAKTQTAKIADNVAPYDGFSTDDKWHFLTRGTFAPLATPRDSTESDVNKLLEAWTR